MLSMVEVITPPPVSSSLAPATAMGLRSAMLVRMVTTGRPFRTRTSTTRGAFSLVRFAIARTTTTATMGSLFALSKGSPNSERSEHNQFFWSLILGSGGYGSLCGGAVHTAHGSRRRILQGHDARDPRDAGGELRAVRAWQPARAACDLPLRVGRAAVKDAVLGEGGA